MRAVSAFHSALTTRLLDRSVSERLRVVLNQSRLAEWTVEMTRLAVVACGDCGWNAAAKGHVASFLPVSRSEYLALDVVAFTQSESRWRFPAAAVELENSSSDDKVAYALWKTLCVHAGLRVTFCYRRERDAANELIRHLRTEVIGAMGLAQRTEIRGETCVVVGHRDEGDTFPHGYFSWWALETNTGTFEAIYSS